MKYSLVILVFSISLVAFSQDRYSDHYTDERWTYEDDRPSSSPTETVGPTREPEDVRETRDTSVDGTYRRDSDDRSYTRTGEGRYIREDNYICYGDVELRCFPN